MSRSGLAIRQRNSAAAAIVAAMSEPDFYPHRPERVELRQTHISFVFLAGELAYKIKKPIRFSFLDYSTIAMRRHFCEEEVRLNRRLAPSTYLGVVPILAGKKGFRLGDLNDRTAEAVEVAVEMHRLPESQMLDALLREGKAGEEEIRAIARKLAAFHSAASASRARVYGAPDVIAKAIEDNFQETERFIGRTIRSEDHRRLREYNREALSAQRLLFQYRIAEGRVREGHGDLRAEHICLIRDIEIFDCIEFSERLRTCDVASELAFLAMDLDFLGHPCLARELTATYAEAAEDEGLLRLLPFYQCYRATVRGKVESLKSAEPEVPAAEREKATADARRYFRFARRYADGAPPAALVIVCGLTGSGKSTVARELADRSGFSSFNSDVVRKRLAGVSRTAHAIQGYRAGIYSHDFTELTYDALRLEAKRCLERGVGVILDATFKSVRHRRLFRNLAEDLHVPVLFVECAADEREIRRRLKDREQQPDEVSDANWEVYLRQRKEFAPLREIPDPCHVRVRTDLGLEDSLAEVEKLLRQTSSDHAGGTTSSVAADRPDG